MKHYFKTVKENMVLANPIMVEKSFILFDKYLTKMKDLNEDYYWEFMLETHELIFGPHFNKEYAEWVVSQMYHFENNVEIYKEKWSVHEASQVYSQHALKLKNINTYDFYVAINAKYHDLTVYLQSNFPDKWEKMIIDLTIETAICDADWYGENKIWDMYGKRKHCK